MKVSYDEAIKMARDAIAKGDSDPSVGTVELSSKKKYTIHFHIYIPAEKEEEPGAIQ